MIFKKHCGIIKQIETIFEELKKIVSYENTADFQRLSLGRHKFEQKYGKANGGFFWLKSWELSCLEKSARQNCQR
ncbi:MAG: hypothetical protein L6V93_05495 [Clostridiales bacterium]|nr:MAG: hypothetical protein L6V93_05495 [Clostridiales bacterium]